MKQLEPSVANETILAQMFADEIQQARNKVRQRTAEELLEDICREMDR